jgi:hypothetical protein
MITSRGGLTDEKVDILDVMREAREFSREGFLCSGGRLSTSLNLRWNDIGCSARSTFCLGAITQNLSDPCRLSFILGFRATAVDLNILLMTLSIFGKTFVSLANITTSHLQTLDSPYSRLYP